MKRFLAITRIWILAVPFLLSFVGSASNQLVLAANHDKFPVMLNERKTVQFAPDTYGIIDDEAHCVMTSETHLNFLADWIDLKSAIYSPGDLLLEAGDLASDWAFPVWGAVLAIALYKRQD